MIALERLWRRIHEPRVYRTLWSLIYLFLASGGIAALFSPPNALEGSIGLTLTYLWGGFLIAAGLFGAPGVLTGRWWAERIAMQAALTGTSVYAVVILHLHLASEAGNRLPQFCAVAALALVFVTKLYEIRGLNYEPRA